MATEKDEKAAAKRVQKILGELKKAPPSDSETLSDQLRQAMDEYAKLFREVRLKAG